MIRMFLGAALMMLLCATEMMAQVNQATQTIRGHVCDVASGEPMIGVTITVENGTTLATVSDVDGNFIINNVPVGRHAVRATFIGYEPVLLKEQLVSSGKELFLAQKPTFDDKAEFMATVTRRLDAVEFVRQHQEATLRRYKLAMVAAFVVGIVSGAVTMAFVLSTPVDVPLFTFSVESSILLWVAENSRLIATTGLALLMSFGIMSIISNVQDILDLRPKRVLR